MFCSAWPFKKVHDDELKIVRRAKAITNLERNFEKMIKVGKGIPFSQFLNVGGRWKRCCACWLGPKVSRVESNLPNEHAAPLWACVGWIVGWSLYHCSTRMVVVVIQALVFGKRLCQRRRRLFFVVLFFPSSLCGRFRISLFGSKHRINGIPDKVWYVVDDSK